MPLAREIHLCRCCHTRTAHRVTRERVLAPVHWCQSCFRVWVDDGQAAQAPTRRLRSTVSIGLGPVQMQKL